MVMAIFFFFVAFVLGLSFYLGSKARTASGYVGRAGDRVFAKLDEAQTHFFNTKSGESLNIRLGN